MSKENIEWESEMKRLMNLGVPHDMMANFIRQTLARQKQEIREAVEKLSESKPKWKPIYKRKH